MRLLNMLNIFALSVSQDIAIDFGRLPNTLKHMGIGMLSIFIVIGVIILSVYALNKAMMAIEAKKEAKNKE